MQELSQLELQKLVIKYRFCNSKSKYNTSKFIGQVRLGVEILAFCPSDKSIGLNYPTFICKCFCGRLFLRECRHIEKSQNISCGHCNDEVKLTLNKYEMYSNIPQSIIVYLLNTPIYIVDKSKYMGVEKGTKIAKVEILKYLPSLKNG